MPGEAHARSKRGICGAKQRNVPFRARRCTKWLALVMSSRPPLAVRPYSGGSGRVQNNPSRSAHADSTKTSNCGENPRSTAERHLDFSSLPRPFRTISVAVRSLIFFRMLVCANTELPQQRAAALRTSARSGNGAVQTSWRPATAKHHCPAFIGRPTRTTIPGPPPQRHRDHRDAQTRATRASRRVLLA
jgi:hypothetical protein